MGGHVWPARLNLADCPGCRGQVVLVLMENCPVCNEPVKELRMRTDHMVQGQVVAAVCRGQQTFAEIMEIVVERKHFEEAERTELLTAEAEYQRRVALPVATSK